MVKLHCYPPDEFESNVLINPGFHGYIYRLNNTFDGWKDYILQISYNEGFSLFTFDYNSFVCKITRVYITEEYISQNYTKVYGA